MMEGGSVAGSATDQLGLWIMVQGRPFNRDSQFPKNEWDLWWGKGKRFTLSRICIGNVQIWIGFMKFGLFWEMHYFFGWSMGILIMKFFYYKKLLCIRCLACKANAKSVPYLMVHFLCHSLGVERSRQETWDFRVVARLVEGMLQGL